MKGRQIFLVGLFGAHLLLSACALHAETVGERFDRAMKGLEKNCAKAKLKPNDTSCDILKLKPADPLATEEGRFAHSIKIPNPIPEDSGYKPGMTAEQYFDHLCKNEAGEFIYRTVQNVEGLYMMRPRKEATDYMQEHLYALEDPYGHTDWEARDPQTVFVDPPWRAYSYLEAPSSASSAVKSPNLQYRRYSGYVQGKSSMVVEMVSKLESRYGYTWRGVSRPHDRELGIAGGELIVLDLETKEVLGVRRGFIRTGGVQNNITGIWWLSGQVCPVLRPDKRSQKDGDFTYWFVSKILRPTAS
ncbi:MAG TPA: hypothetical protein VJR03_05490 [Nitrospira sp.]|nr:hypothetical protein [Nitrospira sp.]